MKVGGSIEKNARDARIKGILRSIIRQKGGPRDTRLPTLTKKYGADYIAFLLNQVVHEGY